MSFITIGSDLGELTETDLEFMRFVADHMPPCRYTREGNVVTIHVQVPDNDAPIINWFGWDQKVFDDWKSEKR